MKDYIRIQKGDIMLVVASKNDVYRLGQALIQGTYAYAELVPAVTCDVSGLSSFIKNTATAIVYNARLGTMHYLNVSSF